MRIRLLGAVDITDAGGGFVPAGPAKQSCLLAVLACAAGQPVPVETLIDRIWDDDPPLHARDALYLYASRLRPLLRAAGVELRKAGGGYRLEVDPDEVDLHRARSLVTAARAARTAGDGVAAADGYARAAALWRGTPLSGLGGAWAAGVRAALDRECLLVLGERFDVELTLGRHADVLPELSALTSAYPLAEPLVGQLMVALYRAGRTAEALEAFTRTDERLRDQLGVDPGPALAELHRRILRNDPDLLGAGAPRPGPTPPVPRQLPAVAGHFVGRHDELAALERLASTDTGASAPIVVIAGMAGVGKTTTALHWAHGAADRFPDGQLYVNLRGFDPTGCPVPPGEAVRGFLDAFEVPPHRIPGTLDRQAALYRSLLAGRRVLVVLDNARDAEQIRPLLPGTPGCLVIVTSRNRLTGLIAAEDAQLLALAPLTAAESRLLLARRLGEDRVAAEPRAVDELIARCAGLPMALAVVAARAAAAPNFHLGALAGQLRDARGGLEPFTGEDSATDARAVFSWSYRILGPAAARLFRLVGLHPGTDIAVPAAASLAGVPATEVRPLLAELARAHLVVEHAPDRFAVHDLLRAYALELAVREDAEPDRAAAVRRVLDHYLRTAHAADRIVYPNRHPIALLPAEPGVTPEPLDGAAEALAWCATESPNVRAALDLAAGAGFDGHTWQLAWVLMNYFQRRGKFTDQEEVQRAGLAAAERLGDAAALAHAHRGLARALTQLSRYEDSEAHLRAALDLCGRLGDYAAQAQIHLALSWAFQRQGRYAEALEQARDARRLFTAAGDAVGQARALASVGWFHTLLGDHREAISRCEEAIAQLRALGERHAEAAAWDSLGHAHHHLGHHRLATQSYLKAVALYHDLGDQHVEATVLTHLGDAQYTAGDHTAARRTWERALAILERLGHPEAELARARLDGLGASLSGSRQS